MSRQSDMYHRRIAAGLCAQCGKKPLFTKTHCQGCRDKHNARANARYKGGKWVEGGRGRPPKWATKPPTIDTKPSEGEKG